jgi:hypothetical protein
MAIEMGDRRGKAGSSRLGPLRSGTHQGEFTGCFCCFRAPVQQAGELPPAGMELAADARATRQFSSSNPQERGRQW